MDISRSSSDKLLLKYAMKNDKKEDIFHSSGYAKSQSGSNFGAAGGSGETFSARRDIDAERKFIQGYKNSRITNEYLGVQRAKKLAGTAIARVNSRNNSETANPMDIAMTRAKEASSGSMGKPSAGLRARIGNAQTGNAHMGASQSSPNLGVRRPTLGTAKAPSIPSRRSGI
ncbi:hypothetical protein IKE84_02040 [Candidatus Saccharibacteria bacterium]|nr:hypothetical protein [Candidatus Saccharibacteria bacterium]